MMLVALLCGCASQKQSDPSGSEWIVIQGGIGEGPITASALVPLEAATVVYDNPDAPNEPITLITEPTNRFGAAWSRRDGDRRTEFLRDDERGNIVMTAAIDHADRAISLFDPPLIIAYATLAPGERREQQVRIRVVDEGNPQKQKETGRATQTIEHAGDAMIRTRAGEARASQIVIRFHADLRMADADTTTTLFIDADRGVIGRRREEKVVILGVPSRSSRETLQLRSVEDERSGD